jgi:hypothetical protein
MGMQHNVLHRKTQIKTIKIKTEMFTTQQTYENLKNYKNNNKNPND